MISVIREGWRASSSDQFAVYIFVLFDHSIAYNAATHHRTCGSFVSFLCVFIFYPLRARGRCKREKPTAEGNCVTIYLEPCCLIQAARGVLSKRVLAFRFFFVTHAWKIDSNFARSYREGSAAQTTVQCVRFGPFFTDSPSPVSRARVALLPAASTCRRWAAP